MEPSPSAFRAVSASPCVPAAPALQQPHQDGISVQDPIATPWERFIQVLIRNGLFTPECKPMGPTCTESLQGLQEDELLRLCTLFHEPLTFRTRGGSYKIPYTLSQLILDLKQIIQTELKLNLVSIELAGSTVFKILGWSYFVRFFEQMGLSIEKDLSPDLVAALQAEFNKPLTDIDLRLNVPGANENIREALSKLIVQYLAQKLMERYPEDFPKFEDAETIIYEQAFTKLHNVIMPWKGRNYFIAGFSDGIQWNTETLWVQELACKHLFIRDALYLIVPEELLTGVPYLKPIVPVSEYRFPCKVLFDRASKVLDMETSAGIGKNGFGYLLLQSLKGYCSISSQTEAIFFQTFIQGGNNNHRRPEALIQMFKEVLRDHGGSSPALRVGLTLRALNALFRCQLKEEEIEQVRWGMIEGTFEGLMELPPLLRPILTLLFEKTVSAKFVCNYFGACAALAFLTQARRDMHYDAHRSEDYALLKLASTRETLWLDVPLSSTACFKGVLAHSAVLRIPSCREIYIQFMQKRTFVPDDFPKNILVHVYEGLDSLARDMCLHEEPLLRAMGTRLEIALQRNRSTRVFCDWVFQNFASTYRYEMQIECSATLLKSMENAFPPPPEAASFSLFRRMVNLPENEIDEGWIEGLVLTGIPQLQRLAWVLLNENPENHTEHRLTKFCTSFIPAQLSFALKICKCFETRFTPKTHRELLLKIAIALKDSSKTPESTFSTDIPYLVEVLCRTGTSEEGLDTSSSLWILKSLQELNLEPLAQKWLHRISTAKHFAVEPRGILDAWTRTAVRQGLREEDGLRNFEAFAIDRSPRELERAPLEILEKCLTRICAPVADSEDPWINTVIVLYRFMLERVLASKIDVASNPGIFAHLQKALFSSSISPLILQKSLYLRLVATVDQSFQRSNAVGSLLFPQAAERITQGVERVLVNLRTLNCPTESFSLCIALGKVVPALIDKDDYVKTLFWSLDLLKDPLAIEEALLKILEQCLQWINALEAVPQDPLINKVFDLYRSTLERLWAGEIDFTKNPGVCEHLQKALFSSSISPQTLQQPLYLKLVSSVDQNLRISQTLGLQLPPQMVERITLTAERVLENLGALNRSTESFSLCLALGKAAPAVIGKDGYLKTLFWSLGLLEGPQKITAEQQVQLQEIIVTLHTISSFSDDPSNVEGPLAFLHAENKMLRIFGADPSLPHCQYAVVLLLQNALELLKTPKEIAKHAPRLLVLKKLLAPALKSGGRQIDLAFIRALTSTKQASLLPQVISIMTNILSYDIALETNRSRCDALMQVLEYGSAIQTTEQVQSMLIRFSKVLESSPRLNFSIKHLIVILHQSPCVTLRQLAHTIFMHELGRPGLSIFAEDDDAQFMKASLEQFKTLLSHFTWQNFVLVKNAMATPAISKKLASKRWDELYRNWFEAAMSVALAGGNVQQFADACDFCLSHIHSIAKMGEKERVIALFCDLLIAYPKEALEGQLKKVFDEIFGNLKAIESLSAIKSHPSQPLRLLFLSTLIQRAAASTAVSNYFRILTHVLDHIDVFVMTPQEIPCLDAIFRMSIALLSYYKFNSPFERFILNTVEIVVCLYQHGKRLTTVNTCLCQFHTITENNYTFHAPGFALKALADASEKLDQILNTKWEPVVEDAPSITKSGIVCIGKQLIGHPSSPASLKGYVAYMQVMGLFITRLLAAEISIPLFQNYIMDVMIGNIFEMYTASAKHQQKNVHEIFNLFKRFALIVPQRINDLLHHEQKVSEWFVIFMTAGVNVHIEDVSEMIFHLMCPQHVTPDRPHNRYSLPASPFEKSKMLFLKTIQRLTQPQPVLVMVSQLMKALDLLEGYSRIYCKRDRPSLDHAVAMIVTSIQNAHTNLRCHGLSFDRISRALITAYSNLEMPSRLQIVENERVGITTIIHIMLYMNKNTPNTGKMGHEIKHDPLAYALHILRMAIVKNYAEEGLRHYFQLADEMISHVVERVLLNDTTELLPSFLSVFCIRPNNSSNTLSSQDIKGRAVVFNKFLKSLLSSPIPPPKANDCAMKCYAEAATVYQLYEQCPALKAAAEAILAR